MCHCDPGRPKRDRPKQSRWMGNPPDRACSVTRVLLVMTTQVVRRYRNGPLMIDTLTPVATEGPWDPGIRSGTSPELVPLASIFRRESIFNDVSQVLELHEVTGIDIEELAIFRPKRLALHEVLVRVTADYEIPDPKDASVDSLGVTLRRMARVLMSEVVDPSAREINDAYARMRRDVSAAVEQELKRYFAPCEPRSVSKADLNARWRFWLRRPETVRPPRHDDSAWDRENRMLQDWRERLHTSQLAAEAAALRSLVRVASAIQCCRGRVLGAHSFLGPLAVDLACNEHGAEVVSRVLDPKIDDAARLSGFRRLPAQTRPTAMLTKGASASGKSTMRPLQRKLARRMGHQWNDFALVSPDTWRRFLLDFDSLGSLYKYAGTLTSHELNIIDRKLDAHLVRKGEESRASHLLIDRFRFDSFALDSEENRTASHFGNLLCYFFMITPPEETVERAWKRGLEIGRYKAVDDLLAHNVQAFTGMQEILFGRALNPSRKVHFEFLDNGVPRGEVPFTAAFGWGGEMNILDIRRMLDVEMYRHINVGARSPAEVYRTPKIAEGSSHAGFLAKCIRRFPQLNLADRGTGRVRIRFENGRLQWIDYHAFAQMNYDEEARDGLASAAPEIFQTKAPAAAEPVFLQPERFHTIGRWLSRG